MNIKELNLNDVSCISGGKRNNDKKTQVKGAANIGGTVYNIGKTAFKIVLPFALIGIGHYMIEDTGAYFAERHRVIHSKRTTLGVLLISAGATLGVLNVSHALS